MTDKAKQAVDDAVKVFNLSLIKNSSGDKYGTAYGIPVETIQFALSHLKMCMDEGWKDISTAPKDGTIVFLNVEGFGFRMGSYGVCDTQHDGFVANSGKPCWRSWQLTRMLPLRKLYWKPLEQPSEKHLKEFQESFK